MTIPPIHPGEILQTEFLEPLGISQYRLAKNIRVTPRRINEIVQGKRSITADTAIRFGLYFGTSPDFWLNLQNRFDLEKTMQLWRNKNRVNLHNEIIGMRNASAA